MNPKLISNRCLLGEATTLLVAAVISLALIGQPSCGQQQLQQQAASLVNQLPGRTTAAGILASSADGLSRYLAPDGPIQPALTAIGGLPVRGIEYANRGISDISRRLDGGARSMAQAAGQSPDQIKMPGMQALESQMPQSVVNMGNQMQSAIRSKNNFIRNQAEMGIQASQRLGQMMMGGLQARSSHSVGAGMGDLMGDMSQSMHRGAETIKSQLKQSMNGHMSRLGQMHGMGEGMRVQAQGIARTLQNGVSGVMNQVSQTGQQLTQQLRKGSMKNMSVMSGMMDSMHSSMGNMGKNMDSNLKGLLGHAQRMGSQMSGSLQQVVQAPLDMIQNLGKSMSSKGQSGGGGSSRY